MNKIPALRRTLLLLPLLVVPITQVDAQSSQSTAAPDELFRTIASLDDALFDAYNRCDVEKFVALLADDLEFYHDRGGLTRGNLTVGEQIKKNICGKVRRELVPGTLEVYPMRGYGAVEIGVHRFHHPNAESTEPVGEAKFIHLWQKKDGVWKITRVISYDHHALAK
jgi:ketosteroid isomerase-like protein